MFKNLKERAKFIIKDFLIRSRKRLKVKINSLKQKKYEHPSFYHKVKTSGLASTKRNPLLIVSITSYPKRLKTTHFALHTLLNQSIKPDKLVLWLAKEQFPRREKDIPRKIRSLKKYGLSIEWCNDIRSYKKLIPTLKEYPNDIIVTADDDIYYPNNWLEILYESYLKNKDVIHCHRAHKILFDKNDVLMPYNQWDRQTSDRSISFRSFITGGGGVVFPPNALYEDILKEDLFLKLSPNADDIWFWAMAVLGGTKMQVVENNISNISEISETSNVGLWETINKSGHQDIQLKDVFSHYKKLKEIIESEK